MLNNYCVVVLLLTFSATHLYAGGGSGLQPGDQAALAKTLELLNNPDLASSNPANKNVIAITGKDDETARAIYAVSGEIFQTLIQQADGDSTKLLELLEQAKKDPASFAAKLSPASLEKIREIGKRLPAGKVR